MGEDSGLARFAEYGIASTRAFTMRLAVIGQRLDCKRRSCQLNAAALGLTFRVWSLHALPLAPYTLIAPLISYLTSSIRINQTLFIPPASFGLLVRQSITDLLTDFSLASLFPILRCNGSNLPYIPIKRLHCLSLSLFP